MHVVYENEVKQPSTLVTAISASSYSDEQTHFSTEFIPDLTPSHFNFWMLPLKAKKASA